MKNPWEWDENDLLDMVKAGTQGSIIFSSLVYRERRWLEELELAFVHIAVASAKSLKIILFPNASGLVEYLKKFRKCLRVDNAITSSSLCLMPIYVIC